MNIGFLITGRLKSTRLPRKLLLEIDNKPIIGYMIERLKTVSVLDEIVICTSTNKQDDPLKKLANEYNIKCFRGSEEDVIKRLYDASKYFGFDYVLNITADCPLVSLEYIKKIIETYRKTNVDFIRALDLPHGIYSYGLNIPAIKKVCEIKKSDDTEVWGRYLTDTGLFNVVDLDIKNEHKRPEIRMTLDYPEDFEFFKKLFEHFGEEIYSVDLDDIIPFLDQNPYIIKINSHCEELYKKRWSSQNNLEV